MREIMKEIRSEHSTAEGIYKFTSLPNTKNFLDRATKPIAIILGDDMRFWVVTLDLGEQLIKSGYEVAE